MTLLAEPIVSAPSPLLSARGVSVEFGGVRVLSDIDWDVAPGEVHGLVGCNGAGKSTLMKVLAGANPHYLGEIRLENEVIALSSPRAALERGIAMVYQELSGIGQLSVAENLCLGRQPRTKFGTIDWKRMNREARETLAELQVEIDVTRRLDQYPLVVRQMVEIARGLQSGARVLILDEPTSTLSLPEARRLFALMTQLKARGVAMVFISHFLEDVLAVCDRVTVLRDGKKVTTQAAASLTRQEILQQMAGRGDDASSEIAAEATLPARSTERLRLEVRGLSARGLFQDVSLEIHAGECLGLYGFVGAGHQEFVQAVGGVIPVDAGTICVDGKSLKTGDVPAAVQQGVVLVAADRARTVARRAPVAHNATVAHLTSSVGRWITRANEERVTQPLLNRVGCRPPNPRLLAGNLSGGNQQKVVFAKWLLGSIHVLLLEEPTRGMDVHAKAEILQLVREQQSQGVAVLLASTEPELLLSSADRIVTFCRGRVTQEFSGRAVTRQDLLFAAEESHTGGIESAS